MKLQNIKSRNPLSALASSCGLFIFLSFFLFSSCEKFLSQTSTNEIADGNMFTDLASLENARIGLYNTLQNQYYYGGYYQLTADAYSDNGATGGYDNLDLDELGLKAATPNNIYIENIWISIYNTIYTANQIIGNVDVIEDPLLSDELRNDIKGEALTIRAMAHFDLLRMFGEHWNLSSDLGIPVVTSVLETTTQIGRSTVAETYSAILNDLTEAENLLSNDDLRFDPPPFKGVQFITQMACEAFLARVYQYKKDYVNADAYAVLVIGLKGPPDYDVNAIYTTKPSDESIFEVFFDAQDKSQFNALTYARPDALRSEVSFLAAENMKTFFESRPDDTRSDLIDFTDNDVSIEPDGRTQKYRGEVFQDNSAFVLRRSEMILISAEAKGFAGDGIGQINFLRAFRGEIADITAANEDEFNQILMDERRAELNFEGHRYFDLAHFGKVNEILGDDVLPCLPIPQREIGASGGILEQYPGY